MFYRFALFLSARKESSERSRRILHSIWNGPPKELEAISWWEVSENNFSCIFWQCWIWDEDLFLSPCSVFPGYSVDPTLAVLTLLFPAFCHCRNLVVDFQMGCGFRFFSVLSWFTQCTQCRAENHLGNTWVFLLSVSWTFGNRWPDNVTWKHRVFSSLLGSLVEPKRSPGQGEHPPGQGAAPRWNFGLFAWPG